MVFTQNRADYMILLDPRQKRTKDFSNVGYVAYLSLEPSPHFAQLPLEVSGQ